MMNRYRRVVSVLTAGALISSLLPVAIVPSVAVAAVPEGTMSYQGVVVPASYDWAHSVAQSVAYDDSNDEVYILDNSGGSIVRYNGTTGARLAVTTSVAGVALPTDGSTGDLEAFAGGVRYMHQSQGNLLELRRDGTSSTVVVASALSSAKAFASDTTNTIWVADGLYPAERIRRLGVGGGGPTATVSADVLFPKDIADFGSGVFVTDGSSGAGRVRRMSAAGAVESSWTTLGPTAQGVAVSNGSTVVVSDSSNSQLMTFDTSLTPIAKFGTNGFQDGQLNLPTFLASVQASDGVWVANRNNARADLFGVDGSFRRKMGSGPRAESGYFAKPVDLDVDAVGNVYVLDRQNGRVQVLDSAGGFLRSTPATPGLNTGSAYAVTVGPDGRIYVANAGQVTVFRNDCSYLGYFNDGLGATRDVAVGGDGRIYVADAMNGLRIFDASSWALVESRASSAVRLASNEYGYVFIADGTNFIKIAPDGTQQSLGTPPSGSANNFDVDLAGNVYDVAQYGVTVRDYLNLNTFATFGSAGNGTERFRSALGVAVTRDGHIWVSDATLHRIQKFRYYDRTAPSSLANVGTAWRTTPTATVSLEASDPAPGTGVAAVWTSVDGGAAQIRGGVLSNPYSGNWAVDVTGDGTHTIETRAIDGYSNSETSHSATVRIDSVAPSVTVSADWPADNSWISHDLTVSVSTEDTTSGMGTVTGPSNFTQVSPGVWAASTENMPLSFSGVTAYDVAGNQRFRAGSSNSFRIDKTIPVTTAYVPTDPWTPFDVQLVPSDMGGSGISELRWSLDGSAPETATGPGASLVAISTPGTHTIEYRAVDNVGNTETSKTVQVVAGGDGGGGGGGGSGSIDGFTLAIQPGDLTGAYVTTLTVPGTNLAEMRVRYGADAWTSWYPWASETTVAIPADEGAHTLYAQFRNAAKDWGDSRSTPVNVDRTPPITTCNVGDNALWPDPAQLTFVGDDPVSGGVNSGVAETYYIVDGGLPTVGTAVDVSGEGSHTIEWWSVDAVGNIEDHNTAEFIIGEPVATTWKRIGGSNRWAVAVNLGKEVFGPNWRKDDDTPVDTVIIACGSDAKAADPLGAAGLAGVIEAPLLLVRNDGILQVPNETKNALSEIVSKTGAKPEIIIIGGTGTITTAHVNALKGYDKNGSLQRIAGNDRYQVAANIAYEMKKRSGNVNPDRVFIASGQSTRFFDPLAAGALAAADGSPVLLVNGSTIPGYTRTAVTALAPDANDRYVVGHASVISAGALSSLEVPSGNRIAGSDSTRQRTAAAAATWGLSNGVITTRYVGLTNKLADALGGSGALGIMGGGVLYTAENATLGSPSSSWLGLNGGSTETIYVIGGEGSIPNATGNTAAAAANAAP